MSLRSARPPGPGGLAEVPASVRGSRPHLEEIAVAGAYSYVFDGQWGYLDHALATGGLSPQVAGVAEWHIDADERARLQYIWIPEPRS